MLYNCNCNRTKDCEQCNFLLKKSMQKTQGSLFHKWHTSIDGIVHGLHDQRANNFTFELNSSLKSPSNSSSNTAQGSPPFDLVFLPCGAFISSYHISTISLSSLASGNVGSLVMQSWFKLHLLQKIQELFTEKSCKTLAKRSNIVGQTSEICLFNRTFDPLATSQNLAHQMFL